MWILTIILSDSKYNTDFDFILNDSGRSDKLLIKELKF